MKIGELIKPLKIALLLVVIQLVLGLLVVYFPPEGIKITDDFSLKFARPSDFFEDKLKEVKVVQDLSALYSDKKNVLDSNLAGKIDSSLLDQIIVLKEQDRIIHPSDFENGLYNFYHQLSKLNELDQPLRILHFGDSQLEGDRISNVLRESMQALFGGCGIGFVPISESNTGRLSVIKKVSGWEKYQVFGKGRKGKHSKYGFMGYYHRIGSDSLENKSANIEIRKNAKYYPKSQEFETFSVLYGNSTQTIDYTLKSDSGIISKGNLVGNGEVSRRAWQLSGFQDGKVSLSFTADQSPDFYGISLDCRKGVAVDNIPLRGSSGTEFTEMDKENLKVQLKDLNVGLIIYQFGLNVAPAELKSYKYYENRMYKQLQLLKEILPNTSILVVSVTDACKSETESFANIDVLRDAQKSAAKRANCSFWDLYEVMGGELSMPSWVNANPSLAEKDFKHFNNRGAKIVGAKLFNALMADYIDFKSLQVN